MRAMILAAGVGSRLDPLTRNVPKPLVPIINRPVMEYLILLLKQHGFHDIMVNVHYLGNVIADYFGDGSKWGVNIHWSHEDELWGDAGSVKRVQEFFQNETFLVIGGDDLTDMDLTAVVQTHKSKSRRRPRSRFPSWTIRASTALCSWTKNSRITRFLEKPKGEVFSKTANTGVYVFEPSVFELIPAHTFFLFGKQLFPVDDGKRTGRCTDTSPTAYWKDVGNVKVYKQTQRDVLGRAGQRPACPCTRKVKTSGRATMLSWIRAAKTRLPGRYRQRCHRRSRAQQWEINYRDRRQLPYSGRARRSTTPFCGKGVTVGAGTHLERCIVGRNVQVQTNAAIFDGIIADPNRPMTAG